MEEDDFFSTEEVLNSMASLADRMIMSAFLLVHPKL